MKLNKVIAVLVLIGSLIGFPTQLIAKPLVISPDLPLEKQVELFTLVYGGDAEIIKKMIHEESGWKMSAVGDSGLSRGVGQFQESSFNRLSKLMGEKLDYNSSYDQIKLLVWSVANGHGREWTSYRCIINGGTYSFYSNQLKRHFKVTCK